MIKKIKNLLNKHIFKEMGKDSPYHECDLCCKYICMEIDTPKTKKDFDEIRWFLLHNNVWIYIDHDSSWNIQFNTKCKQLKNGLCGIYKKRPQICREHSHKECEKNGEGEPHKTLFKDLKEFEIWMEQKGRLENNRFLSN